jgi:hypothetical protein
LTGYKKEKQKLQDYSGYLYGTMDGAEKYDSTATCQAGVLVMPDGWGLVEFSEQILEFVVTQPGNSGEAQAHWGTDYLIFKNGASYSTKDGSQNPQPGGDGSGVMGTLRYDQVATQEKYGPPEGWCDPENKNPTDPSNVNMKVLIRRYKSSDEFLRQIDGGCGGCYRSVSHEKYEYAVMDAATVYTRQR